MNTTKPVITTEMQKKYADLLIENMERKARGERTRTKMELYALAGYNSKNKNCRIDTEKGIGFQEYFQKLISNSSLGAVHKRQLESRNMKVEYFDGMVDDKRIKKIVRASGATIIEIIEYLDAKKNFKKKVYMSVPNTKARDGALDKAYKLLGAYAPEKSLAVNFTMADLLNELNGNQLDTDFTDDEEPEEPFEEQDMEIESSVQDKKQIQTDDTVQDEQGAVALSSEQMVEEHHSEI